MKERFKEYHSYTEEQYVEMWEKCIFVFDANTLLNMYRYSRPTADAYFDALEAIGKKGQVWIPHRVGLEFYENRINVITEYEKSYDEILSILNKAKLDVQSKVKRHPFLDLDWIKVEMESGLSSIEDRINQAKNSHPKWLENDDVLDKIIRLFDGNVGEKYDEKRLQEISERGKKRYEKKVPPGFKDEKKTDEKKYGDLILWFQIIDKAKECKKPVILISDDAKEDWWLEKDGKRLMPLPALKKELHEEAGVDFHMYTSEKFLEHCRNKFAKTKPQAQIQDAAIAEVRRVRVREDSRQARMSAQQFYSGDAEIRISLETAVQQLYRALMTIRASSRKISNMEFREKTVIAVRSLRGLANEGGILSSRRSEIQNMLPLVENVYEYLYNSTMFFSITEFDRVLLMKSCYLIRTLVSKIKSELLALDCYPTVSCA